MTKPTRVFALTFCAFILDACSRNAPSATPAQRSAPAALPAAIASEPDPSEPGQAHAPQETPTHPLSGNKSEADLYLGAFSEADVQRVAARSGADSGVTWRIRAWSGRADTLLALSFTALNADESIMSAKQLRPEIAVLEKRGADLQRIAAAAVPIDADSCMCDETTGCAEAPVVDFDPARYRIAENREAFGVRLTCHWTAAAAEGESTWLTLFEPEAAQLRAALSREVHSDTADRVCGCSLSSDTTVHILGSQHDGHYDLRLQTRYKKTSFFDDVPLKDPAPPTSIKRLVWNGSHYNETPAPSR